MRRLTDLIATLAGTLGVAAVGVVVALPAPAAVESAGDCYTQLNAMRAAAGVPPASATALPGLAEAATAHADYRARAAADGHADPSAHLQRAGRPGFTGVTVGDRTAAAGLRPGSWRAQFENVTTGGDGLRGVESWAGAPYHRLPMLDANNRAAGCASANAGTLFGRPHAAAVLVTAATWERPLRRLTLWPAPGQRGVPVSFDRLQERPAPFPAAAPTVGYVVSVQADGYAALRLEGMELFEGAGRTPVRAHTAARVPAATSGASLDPNLPSNAAMLAAARPLQPRTTYVVRLSGSVQLHESGAWTAFATRTWSFTTA